MKKRAFTLAEILVAISILSLIGFLAVLPLRRSSTFSRSNPDAVAALISSEMRAAQLRARSRSTPIALVFPSLNGTRGHSQSMYVMEGQFKTQVPRTATLPPEPPPKMVRVIDFSNEFPNTYVFVGKWPVAPDKLRQASLTPAIGTPGAQTLEGWTTPTSKDYQIVFMPDGRVVTNDLVHFDGCFHVLVASNLDYASSSAPAGTASMTATPPSYFELTKVNNPVTVSLSTQGSVSTAKELTAADAAVTDAGAGSPALAAAPALVMAPPTKTPPEVADIQILPKQNPDLTDGFDAIVRPDGYLTLVLRIVDKEGDQVTCSWESEVVTGPGPGSFTIPPGKQTIEFDAIQGCWVSTSIWQPPINAATGNQFKLKATVSDTSGMSYTLTGSAVIDVETRNTGRYFFSDKGYVCSLTGDGSSIRRLQRGRNPMVSPDGSKVAYINDGRVFVMNSDGSRPKKLYEEDDVVFDHPSWSPDGLYLAVDQDNTKVRFIRLHDRVRSSRSLDGREPRWSTDDKLVFVQTSAGPPPSQKLATVEIEPALLFGSTPPPLTATPLALPAPYDTETPDSPAWSSDGGYLTFLCAGTIYSTDSAGASVVKRYTPPDGYSTEKVWLMQGAPATKMVLVERAGTSGRMKACQVDLSGSDMAGSEVVLKQADLSGSCSWGP